MRTAHAPEKPVQFAEKRPERPMPADEGVDDHGRALVLYHDKVRNGQRHNQ